MLRVTPLGAGQHVGGKLSSWEEGKYWRNKLNHVESGSTMFNLVEISCCGKGRSCILLEIAGQLLRCACRLNTNSPILSFLQIVPPFLQAVSQC